MTHGGRRGSCIWHRCLPGEQGVRAWEAEAESVPTSRQPHCHQEMGWNEEEALLGSYVAAAVPPVLPRL